ncbi:MAG: hypothetical protein KGZ39_06420 [Simkania sp.]|nr:hypothetical protein [Simkania sp.]
MGSVRLFLTSAIAFTPLSIFALETSGSIALYEEASGCYSIDNFIVVYDTPHARQVPISKLLQVPIQLTSGPSGFRAPLPGSDITVVTLSEVAQYDKPACFHRSALQTICLTLVRYLNHHGLSGVVIQVMPDEIDAEGKDLRPRGTQSLTLLIRLAVVGEMGTIRLDRDNIEGERNADRNLDYILAGSPLQPALSGNAAEADLFSKDELDEYTYFLNRHPNRRIDTRVYSLYQENKVGLDFLVTENKPWRLYLDVTNTGTEETGRWEETLGFVHTQFTGVDDILRLDWTTDTFESFFTVAASYDRPFLSARKLRWKIFSMFNRYAASELGFQGKAFTGTQGILALTFNQNIFQRRDFFIDLVEGFRYFNIHVHNELNSLQGHGQSQFVEPTLALHFEQLQSLWRIWATAEAQGSPNGFLASNRDNLEDLGRINPSKSWCILNANLFASFYIAPPIPAHEFAFLFQGQYAFSYRLIPQLKFVVGGFNTVRGYPQALDSGDNVVIGRAEYLFHLPPLFKPNPHPTRKLFGRLFRAAPEYIGGRADWDFIVRAFLDTARAVNNHKVQTIEANATMIGSGLGAELMLWQNFMLRADWGISLCKAVNVPIGHNSFYFNMTISY